MMITAHKKFNKSLLATSIGIMLGSVAMTPAVAQETAADAADTEIIQVRGVRGSLSQSMNIKRQSSGVVDAISAVDMGKFPDTNLAESLQRITGVSINRVNGEGSEVTVRGFGGNFNLITLNGRQMPAANVGSITGNPQDKGAAGTSR
jgi:outer membrane receptor for ferrienterochelin and colicin